MARLRFPGRPGQRIGRNYVYSVYDDLKLNAETCGLAQGKIESGLKLFYDLIGYSDEEEFDGFTPEDLAEAEATVTKRKQALQRLLESSENDRPFSSSDTDDTSTTSSSVRRDRGMRDIARKSYDRMIKEGLQKPCDRPKLKQQNLVGKSDLMRTDAEVKKEKPAPDLEKSVVSEKRSIVRRLLEKAQHQAKTRRRRRRSMRPNVKKKFRAKFMYSPASKYSKLRKKLPAILESPEDKIKPVVRSSNDKRATCYDSSNSVQSKGEARSFKNRKRFVLPSMSVRSSRKIIPRKRYITEFGASAGKDEDSQCSRSSISGSSEAISAMDGGSSPEDSQPEDCRQKKVGLLDRPLVVEGKRKWKPSLKVQMKLSQMNCEHPFALKKGDDSSGMSSGSFKDIIKPDMVSRYAEKMAQKPKERPPPDEDKSSEESDAPEDKLEKVAAKIEKLLKSQWEGRLKEESGSSQWQRSQRRTKSIIRKARLQLKKRNLNLRARKKEDEPGFLESVSSFVPEVASVPEVYVPFRESACASTASENDLNLKCVVCGFSKLYSPKEKLYDQVACEACNKFFESFAKTPKQYFCTKDGNCNLDGLKDSLTRKAINSRCKACWLKVCMEKFTVSPIIRDQLVKYVPRLDVPPHNPLLAVDDPEDPEPKPSPEDGPVRGPRIKHVCRRAAVALGLPRATFSENKSAKEAFNLSALPQEEKQKILETQETKLNDAAAPPDPAPPSNKPPRQPAKKKPRKELKLNKNKVQHLLKKSSTSLLIRKEQKKRKLKQSFKKSSLNRNKMKKTLKFSYKSAVKTSLEHHHHRRRPRSSPVVSRRPAKKLRKVRCKQCEGCKAEDCGECAYCLDKKKFGGPNLIKQACMYRRCLRPVMPSTERKPAPPLSNRDFSPSSSSPTSPDGSSCGSSCSSSSSSSSSGSSNSSSSSTASSSSSSSSSSGAEGVREPADVCAASPTFQPQGGRTVSAGLQELVSSSLGSDQPKVYFAEEDEEELFINKEAVPEDDTIVYEDSSSMIELKNASFTPSLMYGLPLEASNSGAPSFASCSGHRQQQRQGCGRKSRYDKDEDMYGSAGSGGQDSNEEEEEDDEDSEDNKHYIYADYWEDYDFDRISSQGFALISSQQIPLPCVCYLCGSVGQEKLIFCVICCEPYHTFCLPEDDVPPEDNLENWCCKRCQCCSVCGLKNNLLKCKKCQSTYHSECLTPHYPSKPSRKKRIWMCPKCVKCKSCGTTSPSPVPGTAALWNFDLLLCQPCAKLTDKGNYCPVCKKCYEENDYDSEMVQCYRCTRWVHAKCDDITEEGYEILSCLPDSVVYTCIACTAERTPMWKMAIKEYLKHGLKCILNSLLSARCARHLIKHDQVQSSGDSSYSNDAPKIPELRLNSRNPSLNETDEIKSTVSNLVEMVDQTISSKDCNAEQLDLSEDSLTSNSTLEEKTFTDLHTLKNKLVSGKYTTIASFFDELLATVEAGNGMGMKHHTSEIRSLLMRETEKIFPWFKIPTTQVWQSKTELPKGMLPNAVLPPSTDHNYSQCMERVISFPPLSLPEDELVDNRICVLCGYTGDSMSKKCGRLMYCSQDEWIHVNCALWSAEVFKQEDGSLRNIHPAISRGKVMLCEFCRGLGATVGCCVRGCPSNYHFYCARKDEAVLQVDRKVFCALHKDHIDHRIVGEKDFLVREKVFVSQTSIAPKWVKKKWAAPMDKDCLRVMIGSLTVHKLGRLTSLSSRRNALIPVDYECTRLFWSTKNPQRRVKYRCRIIEVQVERKSLPAIPIPDTTTVHSPEKAVAEEESENALRDNEASSEDVRKLRNEVGKVVLKMLKKVAKIERKGKCDTPKKNNVIKAVSSTEKPNDVRWSGCNGDSLPCDGDSEVPKNSKLKCSSVEGDRPKSRTTSSDTFEYQDDFLDYYTSLGRKNSSDKLDKKALLSEFLAWLSTRNSELKRYHKRVKASHSDISPHELKLMKLLADKDFSEEQWEETIRQYEDLGLPAKLKNLMKVVGPCEDITETVLPVFSVATNENAGVTESSGYSSNDDNHLRHRSLPGDLNYKEVSIKPAAIVNPLEESRRTSCASAWKKDNKLNGVAVNPKHDLEHFPGKLMRETPEDPSQNGLGQNKGPFKCSKCKRLYRTSESFKKHIESCNFFLDSSSGDESEDEVSTDTSDESCEAVSTKRFRETIGSKSLLSESKSNSSTESAFNPVKLPESNQNLRDCHNQVNNSNFLQKSEESLPKTPDSLSSYQDPNATSCAKPTPPPRLIHQSDSSSYPGQRTEQNLPPAKSKSHIIPSPSQLPNPEPYSVPSVEYTAPSLVEVGRNPNVASVVCDDHMNIGTQQVQSEVVASTHIPSAFGYNTAICENTNGGIVPMPCNTLILPSQPNTIPQLGPNTYLPQPQQLNTSSQVSYVGSITITNNETMSLAMNVPEQMVPIFQQPSFGMMQNPMQMHQSTEYHLSTVNIQQISVQGSYPTNQLVFPQQQVAFPQGQVMFVEEPAPTQNYVFQVPVEQGYTSFVPQQQAQFMNQFQFQAETQMGNVVFQQFPPQFVSGQAPVVESPPFLSEQSPISVPEQSSVPVSEQSPVPPAPERSSVPATQCNAHIVDILKKAAEQMLSLSAGKAKKTGEVPEKKTRFAHTRKVAARKAEKLKQQRNMMSGKALEKPPPIKPKTVHFNIATLKPAFSVPFVPVPFPTNNVQRPDEGSSASPSLSERSTETPMPALPPEAANASLLDFNSIYNYEEEEEDDSPLLKLYMREMEGKERDPLPTDKPYIMYEINSEDGLHVKSKSLREAWMKVYDELQDARIAARMDQITLAPEDINGLHMLGLDNPALMYLLEQLPGAKHCSDYDFVFHPPNKELIEIPENETGCARSEGFNSRREYDMFNFLASEHRNRPVFVPPEEEDESATKSSRRSINMDMPIAMRFTFLKTMARETVGVFRSSIHGRGLFCKRNIDPGELVIEYAGEVIRSVLTDKRERIYQSKGIGCYMFRIDDEEVVDATMHGNAARFINHSCEPNCFSKVITVDSKKHIVIFALRRIIKGEELTYDYKFPFEDEKIPCHCNSRRCRKYLN